MKQFIGREEELRLIDEEYRTRKYGCCSVIGRRRVGKSTLIQKFVEDKRCLYIEFVLGIPDTNLRIMENAISRFTGEDVSYRDFVDAFDDLSRIACSEDLVIVFDEFTYALSYESFSSLTKNLIDRGLGGSFLIICGSLVKMMEEEIENYGKPLYGRTRRVDVYGIELEKTRAFHPGMSDTDLLKLHILTGGSPYYLADTPADTLGEYFDRYVLPPRSVFRDVGEKMIFREFGTPEKYISILDAIGAGRTDIAEISQYAHIDETTCRKMVEKLADTGIIACSKPMCGTPTKPLRYRFRDGMADLHFKVFRRKGMGPHASYATFEGMIDTEIGRLFEPYCADLISANYNVRDIGTWYSKVPLRGDDGKILKEDGRTVTEMAEIDVVAEITDGRNDIELFAECKIRNAPAGTGELRDLDDTLGHVHGKKNYRRMIVSAGGFTKELRGLAETDDVALVDMDCIFGRRGFPEL